MIHKVLYTFASVLIPFGTGAVGLYYSVIGFQHTRLRGFLYWIWAASLGLVGHSFLLMAYSPPVQLPKTAYHGIWIFWCIGYSASALLGTWGTILLVRDLIAKAHEKPA